MEKIHKFYSDANIAGAFSRMVVGVAGSAAHPAAHPRSLGSPGLVGFAGFVEFADSFGSVGFGLSAGYSDEQRSYKDCGHWVGEDSPQAGPHDPRFCSRHR